jgi:predicted transcriptional regulator
MRAELKAQVHQLVNDLPADATIDDLMHELYELRSIERALADVQAGRLTPHDEARRLVLQGRKRP